MVSDVYIRFVVSVVDSTVAATDVLRNRNADIKDVLSVCLIFNRREVERRVHLIFIINRDQQKQPMSVHMKKPLLYFHAL